jgi:intein/homing endonuclease
MFPLTKELAYIIGVYLGDGHTYIYHRKDRKSTHYWFRLNCIDYDFLKETKRCLNIIVPERQINIRPIKKSNKFKTERQQYQLMCRDKDLVEFLIGITFNKKKIPEFLLDAEIEIRKAFIVGLLDSEGWVQKSKRTDCSNGGQTQVGICNTEVWIDDVAKMMQRLGVKIGKRQIQKPKESKLIQGKLEKIRYMFQIESFIKSGLYFNIERKQSRLRDYNMALAKRDERIVRTL